MMFSLFAQKGALPYSCSLDAQGAFDAIPHPFLLYKAADIIPDVCWRLLYKWYKHTNVRIRFNGAISKTFSISKGTRQGGLTSPFLFNLFYQDLISELSNYGNGVCIKGSSFNVFCYADDILLASLTATGLQDMINCANKYVNQHGLCFNTAKTSCTILGKCFLSPKPTFKLDDDVIKNTESFSYLDLVLSQKGCNFNY